MINTIFGQAVYKLVTSILKMLMHIGTDNPMPFPYSWYQLVTNKKIE